MLTKPQCEELYNELMAGIATGGVDKVDSIIQRIGRKDIRQFCTYLFTRSIETELTNQRLIKLI